MFEKVQFDGETPVGHFATWYWNASENSEERGTTLLNLERSGEEFRAMERLFFYSMKSDSQIGSIKRVQNNEMRLIYELQRRSLQKKVTGPPRSMSWNTKTMERWAFHAPGCGARSGESAAAAAPWECIIEEGYCKTLAGSANGRVYGAGVYFAKHAALANQYAQRSAYQQSATCPKHAGEEINSPAEAEPLRVFATRIVTGIYTNGTSGMDQPPIDEKGAKGEHFHSLVDNAVDPQIFVINEPTRAYPAYLISYNSTQGRHWSWNLSQNRQQKKPVPAKSSHPTGVDSGKQPAQQQPSRPRKRQSDVDKKAPATAEMASSTQHRKRMRTTTTK